MGIYKQGVRLCGCWLCERLSSVNARINSCAPTTVTFGDHQSRLSSPTRGSWKKKEEEEVEEEEERERALKNQKRKKIPSASRQPTHPMWRREIEVMLRLRWNNQNTEIPKAIFSNRKRNADWIFRRTLKKGEFHLCNWMMVVVLQTVSRLCTLVPNRYSNYCWIRSHVDGREFSTTIEFTNRTEPAAVEMMMDRSSKHFYLENVSKELHWLIVLSVQRKEKLWSSFLLSNIPKILS